MATGANVLRGPGRGSWNDSTDAEWLPRTGAGYSNAMVTEFCARRYTVIIKPRRHAPVVRCPLASAHDMIGHGAWQLSPPAPLRRRRGSHSLRVSVSLQRPGTNRPIVNTCDWMDGLCPLIRSQH